MPLSKQQLAEIKENIEKASKAIADAESDLKQAERAGIDMTERKKTLTELKDRIRKMRTVFG